MARIRLVLEDDNGNPLPDTQRHIYPLQGQCDTLNQIEEAVENFKNQALPQIEMTLLTQAQQRFGTGGGKPEPHPKRKTKPTN